MPLPPLATLTDAQRFGYTLPAATGSALLDRASTRIRAYTRQTITRVDGDVVTLRPQRGRLRLPQRPADKPTSVTADDGLGNVVAVPYWAWDGRMVICPHQIPPVSWVRFDWWLYPPMTALGWLLSCLCTARTATVTYSHGYTTVPDGVLDVTCSVAERLGNTPSGMESGIRDEAVGDYKITYSTDAIDTASGLLPGEKVTLDRLFGRPNATTISLT